MGELLAVIVGALIGAAGFVPVFATATRARKMLATNSVGSLGLLLLSLLISFLVMLVAIALCAHVARSVLFPFVLALALGLSATAIFYGIRANKSAPRTPNASQDAGKASGSGVYTCNEASVGNSADAGSETGARSDTDAGGDAGADSEACNDASMSHKAAPYGKQQ